ncbi:MAG: hypothetical protein J07HX64_02275 [halophilic archaeon J07HX64]|nr:MAG: hypothetical protein J07HX64_02275 [halophilic archaeon J07HX64]
MSDDSSSESVWGTDRSESRSSGEDSDTGWGTDSNPEWDTDSQDPDTPEDEASGEYSEQDRKRAQMYTFVMWTLIMMVEGYALLIAEEFLLGVVAGAIIYLLFQSVTPS